MHRRDLLKLALGGGLAAMATKGSCTMHDSPGRFTPVTGPDHPFAPCKPLVYGVGLTGEQILSRISDEFYGDYWLMWAGVRNNDECCDVAKWGTDLYPFSERNISSLVLLSRLGDVGADLVVPTSLAWQHRVEVRAILLAANPHADAKTLCRAARQQKEVGRLKTVTLLGHREEEVQAALDSCLG